MMKRGNLLKLGFDLSLILVLVLLMFMPVCAKPASSPEVAPREVIKLRASTHSPPSGAREIALQWWAEEIKKRTHGRVQINWHWSGALAKGRDHLASVGRGLFDIALIIPNYTPEKLPLSDAIFCMYGVSSNPLSLSKATWEYYLASPTVREEWGRNDTVPLTVSSIGNNHFICRKPLKGVADFPGCRIRAPGGWLMSILDKMGVTPVSIPIGDVFDALHKGVIDGCTGPYDNIYKFKWFEVAKHLTITETGGVTNAWIVMNKNVWNKLPNDIQKVFMALAKEYIAKYIERYNTHEKEKTQLIKKGGVTFHEFDKEAKERLKKSLELVQEEALKDLEKRGVKVAREVFKGWLKLVRKYEKE